ncbi:MAG: amino acid adenylation domain-containing protein, partial [bacterium]|nr:amino acid adenylation domain-containing protein [bacterium]
LSPFEYDTNKVKFDLTLQGMEVDGELEFRLSYGTKLFKEETILRYIRYFKRILSAVVAEPGRKLSEIELLSPREKQQLLYDFNETAVRYPGNKTLGQLFEEQAARTPDRIAIVGPETNPAQEIQLTYRRLEEMSRRQAAELIQKGLEPGTITGIMAERSIPVIIGILGILKAGGAYMPIDPDYPQERIEYMLRDSGAKIVLKGSREIPRFAKQLEEVEVLNLKEINKNISETLNKMEKEAGIGGENLPEQYNPDQSPPLLSYIIYTSGSTGKPKGVMVEHASVVNLAYYQKKRFKITEDDRVLQFSSLCFDASVEQLFIALLSGATLVLAAKETFMDNLRFDRFTARQGLTHINAVPSFLMNMGLKSVYSIRRIVSGGDVCPPALAEKWSKNCEFYNQYGPTETTVTAIAGKVPVGAGTLTRLPVGKPIANTAVYLLDKNMKPVPGGTAGELHIGGEGITRGYLNRPELTHERFIPNPFIPAQDTAAANNHTTSVTPVSSSTLYKTGDLCRWLPDGTLQFLDRLDSQVKIRGFRIEPGEIETLLTKQETVSEAVVRTWKRSDGDRYLCAYVVYKGTPETDAGFTEDGTTEKGARTAGAGTQLRERLAETLPDYMIPAYFVKLERMPLNSSGKIDRTALPEPATPE